MGAKIVNPEEGRDKESIHAFEASGEQNLTEVATKLQQKLTSLRHYIGLLPMSLILDLIDPNGAGGVKPTPLPSTVLQARQVIVGKIHTSCHN